MAKDLNDYIKKSHIKALEEFKAELEKYKDLLDPEGRLYEDPTQHLFAAQLARECMITCGEGDESMQVVGSDGRTYPNAGNL